MRLTANENISHFCVTLFLFLVAMRDSEGEADNVIITEPCFNMIPNSSPFYCLRHPAKEHVYWDLKLLLILVTFKILLGILLFTLGSRQSSNWSLLHLKPYISSFVCKFIPQYFERID